MGLHEAGEVISTDVLVIGGGLAGCMAAMKAREHGVDVTIMDKEAIRRSGDAATGMDHFPNVAHPKLNGITPEELARRRGIGTEGLVDPDLNLVITKNALHVLAEVEKLGVRTKEEDGTYKLQSGRVIGVHDFIWYRGADLKIKLAAEVRRRKVRVIERTMLTRLLTSEGRVVGATGVNIRTGEFIVVKAKATILASGGAHRLYWHPYGAFPSNLFILYQDPQSCGDGTAAACRAGAKLANLEFAYGHTATMGLPRGITMFVVPWSELRNWEGEKILDRVGDLVEEVPSDPILRTSAAVFLTKGERLSIDMAPHVNPATRACWSFVSANERPYGLRLARLIGDLKDIPTEPRMWASGIVRSIGGVMIDETGRTSLPGLYAAGDVVGGSMMSGATGALVWGYVEGPNAAKEALGRPEPRLQEEQVLREKERVLRPLGREKGIKPLELENTVRKIVTDYVGFQKHESKLNYCLQQLSWLRDEFVPQLRADSPHELMRATEVQSIIDVGELHARSALIRTESRLVPWHYRVDHPRRDDEHWEKALVVWQHDGEFEFSVGAPWNE